MNQSTSSRRAHSTNPQQRKVSIVQPEENNNLTPFDSSKRNQQNKLENTVPINHLLKSPFRTRKKSIQLHYQQNHLNNQHQQLQLSSHFQLQQSAANNPSSFFINNQQLYDIGLGANSQSYFGPAIGTGGTQQMLQTTSTVAVLPQINIDFNPQLLLDSLIGLNKERRELLWRRSTILLENSSFADHASFLPSIDNPVRIKVLCIRLMELLGPQMAQLDAIEKSLFALFKLFINDQAAYKSLKQQIHMEDMLDFILMDDEYVPYSSSDPAAESQQGVVREDYIIQKRMHHKFVANPDLKLAEQIKTERKDNKQIISDHHPLEDKTSCKKCRLKREAKKQKSQSQKTSTTAAQISQNQRRSSTDIEQQQSLHIQQHRLQKYDSSPSTAIVIAQNKSAAVQKNKASVQSLARINIQNNKNQKNKGGSNLQTDSMMDYQNGVIQVLNNPSTFEGEPTIKRTVMSNSQLIATREEKRHQHRNNHAAAAAGLENKATTAYFGHKDGSQNQNQFHTNKSKGLIAQQLSQERVVVGAESDENNLYEDQDQQQFQTQTKVVVDARQGGDDLQQMLLLNDDNDEVEREADRGQKQVIAQYMENLLEQQRHNVQEEVMRTLNSQVGQQDDDVREPYFGTNSQASRIMRQKRHSYNLGASLISGMNNQPMILRHQQDSVMNKVDSAQHLQHKQYKGIKLNQTLNSQKAGDGSEMMFPGVQASGGAPAILLDSPIPAPFSSYFSKRKFSEQRQAGRTTTQLNQQNPSSAMHYKATEIHIQEVNGANNFRKSSMPLGKVSGLNSFQQFITKNGKRVYEDETSMSNSVMALKDNKGADGVAVDHLTEFGDIITQLKKDEPAIRHNGSLPSNSLKSAFKNLTFTSLAKKQEKTHSKQPSLHGNEVADNHSNSIIGQNLFDPSNNNSVRDDQQYMMYQTSQDIFNVSQKPPGSKDPAGRPGYFSKPMTKRMHFNNTNIISNDLSMENQSEIFMGKNGVMVAQNQNQRRNNQQISINDRLKQMNIQANDTSHNNDQLNNSQNLVLQSDNHSQQEIPSQPAEPMEEDEDPLVYCFICGFEYEEHAVDFNIDLLAYNDLIKDCFLNIPLQQQQFNNDASKLPQISSRDASRPRGIGGESRGEAIHLIGSNLSSEQVSHRELNSFAQLKQNLLKKKAKIREQQQQQLSQQQLSPRFHGDHDSGRRNNQTLQQLSNHIINSGRKQQQRSESTLFKMPEGGAFQNNPNNISAYNAESNAVQQQQFVREKGHPVFTSFGAMPDNVSLRDPTLQKQDDDGRKLVPNENDNAIRNLVQHQKQQISKRSPGGRLLAQTVLQPMPVANKVSLRLQGSQANQLLNSTYSLDEKVQERPPPIVAAFQSSTPMVTQSQLQQQCQMTQLSYVNSQFTETELAEIQEKRIHLCEICFNTDLSLTNADQEGYHQCEVKVCQDCMKKCKNQCPYCAQHTEENRQEKQAFSCEGKRCQQCGSFNENLQEPVVKKVEFQPVDRWKCNSCSYTQCLDCTLEFHNDKTCAEMAEQRYTELKKVYSSVTLDPTLRFQMCTQCENVLEKAVRCQHYYCEDCDVIFCMYCREDFTEDHMNPFSEDSCCLFKIGAKQRTLINGYNSGASTQSNSSQSDSGKDIMRIVMLTLLILLLWITLGPLVLLPFIPYFAYQKLFNYMPTYKGSYLLHRHQNEIVSGKDQKGQGSLSDNDKNKNCCKFVAVIVLTPVIYPLTYVCGMAYWLSYLALCCRSASNAGAGSAQDEGLFFNNRSSLANRHRKRKSEKVHTEISLQHKAQNIQQQQQIQLQSLQ